MVEWIRQFSTPWQAAIWVLLVAAFLFACWAATRLNRLVFRKISQKQKGLHLAFFEKVNAAVIVIAGIVIAISALSGVKSVWQTLLGGTAIISAILVFAAQDIIKDILAGMMISIHKPFEIGDRVVLEDGTVGIIEDITMHHVVLRGIDTIRHIIPNSKINAVQLTNYSYHRPDRSVQFSFAVGYNSDMETVKRVIGEAVRESVYARPCGQDEDGSPVYSPVYFLKFAESALIMSVTVYFEKIYKSEIIIDDINTRVREALIENHIEIPYTYINIVSKE